jgi:excisionase family DNA binding protein
MDGQTTEMTDLMRVRELAAKLRLSRGRTYALIQAGELPAVKIGGVLRIPRTAYFQWLESQSAIALQSTREIK